MIKIMSGMKIGSRLILGFGLVGFLLVVGTLAGLSATWIFKMRVDNLYDHYVLPEQQVRAMMESVYRIQSAIEGYLTTRVNAVQAVDVLTREAFEVKSTMERMADGKQTNSQSEPLGRAWTAYEADLKKVEDLLRAEDRDGLLTQIKSGEFAAAQSALLSTALAWHQEQTKIGGTDLLNSQSQFSTLAILLIAAGLLGVIISQAIGYFITRTITNPLKNISVQMERMSRGSPVVMDEIQEETKHATELGQLARGLAGVGEYFTSVSSLADRVASGDLEVRVTPRSDEDLLSAALTRMVSQLADLVREIAGSSMKVGQASQQLASAAQQTSMASGQITTTIQQVAMGLNRQSEDINHTVGAMELTNRAVERVANGASEQETAVLQTIREADQMMVSIEQMSRNAQAVVEAAQDSSQKAEEGAGTLRQTVASMEVIRAQVGELAEKMGAVHMRSEEIGTIIEAIEEIATKTNILAINATIEAAHAEVQAKKMTEEILNQMMTSECHMVNRLLLRGATTETAEYWASLCRQAGLDTILATDEDGVTVLSNDPSLIGFRFSDDPKAQAYPFRQLIRQSNGVYCQEAQARSFDSQVFKYVGVSRADRPGIVQVGLNMQSMRRFDLRINGFAVVASEVYQLAERARESTREIRSLVKGIQSSIAEAGVSMQRSRREVETGMERAGSAGDALQQILSAVKHVTNQATQALNAAAAMSRLSTSLQQEVQTFKRILEENNRAVVELNGGYQLISKTIENTASLSEENSAAAEEVSASAEEMRAQMEEVTNSAAGLERMSVELNELVTRFQLKNTSEDRGSEHVRSEPVVLRQYVHALN